MEEQQNEEKAAGKDNLIGGAQTNIPDAEQQNDTGFAGTTNALSDNQQNEDGYQIAIEDTMIGYNGDESQMDMDPGEEERKRTGKTGVDDND
jgi:hypothetical protein